MTIMFGKFPLPPLSDGTSMSKIGFFANDVNHPIFETVVVGPLTEEREHLLQSLALPFIQETLWGSSDG